MRVIALRPFRGDEGFITPRTVIDVSEKRAKQLFDRKLVTYEIGAKMEVAPANKMAPAAETVKKEEAAPAAKADPTPAPQTGSSTGATKPAPSSSRRARRRGKST